MRSILGFLIIFSLTLFSQDEEIVVMAERGWVFTPSVDNLIEEDISRINAHHFKELMNLSAVQKQLHLPWKRLLAFSHWPNSFLSK